MHKIDQHQIHGQSNVSVAASEAIESRGGCARFAEQLLQRQVMVTAVSVHKYEELKCAVQMHTRECCDRGSVR
jgi:hypothetical protein